MLIRVSGYNSGVKEYLEEGVKNGRDYSREELDERIILEGDLNLTDKIYKMIPDSGQNRYTTFTLSFREDEISNQDLQSITKEFRDFMMYAYEMEEYNFYAEAHLPKIKQVFDKRTGEKIDRKPHIHVVIPKINLLSGKVNDVIGDHDSTERYLEAFQEYINQKYKLASPREHVRVNPYNAADVLSRYKGDDFRGKNREFKQTLVKEIIDTDIRTRSDFYSIVSNYGETKIRNQGKESEYIAVKLPGDEKFTNLKETIFNDNFIIERKLAKPPLAQHVISDRLHEWPMRSKEIKYIAKATKSLRNDYYSSDLDEKVNMLADEQYKFYEKFGGQNELHPSEWSGSDQRSSAKAGAGKHAGTSNSLQSLPRSDVAADGETRITTGAVFLPGNARVHVERESAGGDYRLRPDLHVGGTGGAEVNSEAGETGREGRTGSQEGSGETGERTESYPEGESPSGARKNGEESETGSGEEAARTEGRTGAGGSSESREAKNPGTEETSRASSDPSRFDSTAYPNDAGSRESCRYTGVPELGRNDSRISVRGGSGQRLLDIPVYARNRHSLKDVSAVELNSSRLFNNSSTSATRRTQVQLIRRLIPKSPKSASYVAACLQRRQEQNALSSPQRSALYRADQRYFETRRAIISDNRLSSRDKTQFLSVLTFERLKAHQLVMQPQGNHEEYRMGSENIRSKIKPEPKYKNTVSGEENTEQGPQDAKERFRKLNQQIENDLGERSLREKVRIITAADLYTRKSKLSDNVHYLDNTSHKTLFIDTGKTIAVSKHGLNESAVAVALELAKEKFGSTLTVKGTENFKNTAIEVVAQKGLDIHFTDKEMNRRLAERKQELALEREGQNISSADSAKPESAAEFKKAFSQLAKDFNDLINRVGTMDAESLQKEVDALSKESAGLRNYWMSSDEYSPEAGLENASLDHEDSLREILSQKYDTERAGKDVADFHATWQSGLENHFPTRQLEFEAALSDIEKLYDLLDKNAHSLTPDALRAYAASGREKRVQLSSACYTPELKARLEAQENKLSRTISQMANAQKEQANASPQAPKPQTQRQQSSNKSVSHEGVLLEHGSAPYNFKPDMTKPEGERDDSYYVKLQGNTGKEKVVWGVTLEKAVEGLEIGERVRLSNLGKETVKWEQLLANGQTEERSGERVAWEGRPLDREVEVDETRQYQAYEEFQSLESDGPSVD